MFRFNSSANQGSALVMTHRDCLSLEDSYRLLRLLPLTEKNDQEMEALTEQILGLRDGEEAHRLLLQHHRR